MIKLLSVAGGLALLAGAASAQPVALSDTSMDNVTAGRNVAVAEADAFALAFGFKTFTKADAFTWAITTPFSSESGASSKSVAVSD